MVNNTEILSDNEIIPEEEFSHTILIIKYSKQKKIQHWQTYLVSTLSHWEKKRKIIKI